MRAVVTGTHNRIGYAVVRSLHAAGIPVWAGGTTAMAMGRVSRLPEGRFHHPHPVADPEGFIASLRRVGKRLGEAVLLPTGSETLLVAEAWSELKPWFTATLPAAGQIEAVIDKLKLAEAASEAGLAHPATRLARPEEPPSDYPVVVKPRQGAGGWRLRVCPDRETYVSAVEAILAAGSEAVVQPHAGDDLTGCAMLFDHGREVLRFSHRVGLTLGGRGGTPVVRVGEAALGVEEGLARLLVGLNWHGVCQADFVSGRSGQPQLVDLNPRFWGSLYCATVSGVNFPAACYDLALGRTVTSRSAEPGWATAWAWGLAAAALRRWVSGRGVSLGPGIAWSKLRWDDAAAGDVLPLLFEPVGAVLHNWRGRGLPAQWTQF